MIIDSTLRKIQPRVEILLFFSNSSNALAMVSENLGQRIRKIRKEKKMSLSAVSKQAEISVAYLSKIERDEANPTVEVLERLAEVLQMTLDEIAAGLRSDSYSLEDLPETLRQFIEEYGDKFAELKDPDWQRMLSSVRLRGRYPEKSDDWLMIFLEARRAFE